MSFLKVPSPSPQDAEKIRTVLNPVVTACLQKFMGPDTSPEEAATEWFEKLSSGITPAIELGLSRDHIDALLAQAHDLIRAGQLVKARDKLRLAQRLDPLEERAVYIAAATLQMEQRYADAGRLYASYVMMKPLEADGYLRMGECLLGDGSPDDGREFILAALEIARERQDTATIAHVEKLLNFIDAMSAAIRIRSAPPPADSAQ